MTTPEESKPVLTAKHLSDRIRNRLCQWVPNVFNAPGFCYPDEAKMAHPRATAAVAVFDVALARLKGKTGERAEAAREAITAARAPIAAALDLVNSIGADLNGPIGVELQSRIQATRAALATALAAKEVAPRAQIRDVVIAIEEAWADIRELERDLDSVYERLIVPPLPDLGGLQSAEVSTRALESLPAKPSALQVHAAIQQGLEAPAHVAALFVAFETKPEHPCIQWRAQAVAERAE